MRATTEKILFDYTVRTMMQNGMSREDAETFAKYSVEKKKEMIKSLKHEH